MNRISAAASAPFKPLKISRKLGDSGTSEQKTTLGIKKVKKSTEVMVTQHPSSPVVEISGGSYDVVYRKVSTKKNKTWEGDGVLTRQTEGLKLEKIDGKVLARSRGAVEIEVGALMKVGSYEVEVQNLRMEQQETNGMPLKDVAPNLMKPKVKLSPMKSSIEKKPVIQAPHQTKLPFTINSAKATSHSVINKVPKFDPDAPGAVVMPRPATSRPIVDVVVDPVLALKLRPHQKEGVKFLYECVMNMKDTCITSALLADEMGLGKTLTTIALLWTLLKQNPLAGEPPVIKKALIVCPVTLMANWKKELRKWLGSDAIGVFSVDSNSRIRDFLNSSVYSVVIAGYERIRSISEELQDSNIGIVICDEGHRLKTTANKSAQAILSLNVEKKVILSGTPIQNDLGEFYTMIDFLNPGILGTYSAFKRDFELPIMRSRQPGAPPKDVEKGNDRSTELANITRQFVLRRSTKEIAKFLPPKSDMVLFCKPTSLQLAVYEGLLRSNDVTTALSSTDTSDHLRAITMLKKACNATSLVQEDRRTALASQSGKLRVLEIFLNELRSKTDEKILIVSGYTQTLDIIEQLLKKISGSPRYTRLDGSTPAKKRPQIVDNFNKTSADECFAFLLSAKSGGTGLNLVGASRLVLFDTDWNPSVDLQAMARIHRDGQQKSVFIYRLLTTGCIDEKIYQRQITKQGLADTFMESTEQLDGSMSSTAQPDSFQQSELRDLFTLQMQTKSNTHDLIECDCLDHKEEIWASIPEGPPTDEKETQEKGEEGKGEEEINRGLGGWMTASDIASGKAKPPSKFRAKEKLKQLFDYQHIDPDDARTEIHDDIVKHLTRSKVLSMIFIKKEH